MKLLAIDSNSILNRAYYGVRPLTTREGLFTNGIFGFLNILWKLQDEVQPDAIAFAFDLPAPTFRHKLFDGYKGTRKGMPEELAQQLAPLKALLTGLGYPILTLEGYEADDILGTLGQLCRESGNECVIATGDRDSYQLVGDGVTVRLAFTRGGQSGAETIDPAFLEEKFSLSPRQMIDLKALMGDTSDNIPGVAGVGEKTALSLIQNFGSLDGVYENIDSPLIKKGVREKLLRDKEMAYQSYTLAEINCHVPLPVTLAELSPRPIDREGVYALLQKLELRTMITRLGLGEADAPAPVVTETKAVPVQYQTGWQEIMAEPAPILVFTWEKNVPTAAVLLGAENISLLDQTAADWENLLAAIPAVSEKLTLPDSKAWYRFCYRRAATTPPLVGFDLILAGYLLSPLAAGYDLATLSAGRELTARSLTLGADFPADQTEWVTSLASYPALVDALREDIRQKEMDNLLFTIEMPLARVLASMESLGFSLDADGLRTFGDDLDADLAETTARIYYLAGGEFNINSPKQLGEVLFERLGLPAKRKTKSGYSTDADTLDSLKNKHPIIEDILAYRKLAKLKSTYVDGLLTQIDADGRVRSLFRQTETRTGRISSTEPNLQNIPVRTERGSTLRKFFRAAPGKLLVDADYSQIELRVLAHIANDQNMIQAFLSGEDIHTKTAAQVFDMPEAFVTRQMRSSAKAVNFGIVYGIGAFSLSQDIGVTVKEADRYIQNYLDTYPGVRDYMKETIAYGTEHGYVKTMFGRQRPLPELAASNRITRAFGERVAMNTPIQGTAADIIKLAMVRVFDRLAAEGLEAKLILQVHDELIVEAPKEEAEQVAAIVTAEMEAAVSLAVPMRADAKIAANWLEAK